MLIQSVPDTLTQLTQMGDLTLYEPAGDNPSAERKAPLTPPDLSHCISHVATPQGSKPILKTMVTSQLMGAIEEVLSCDKMQEVLDVSVVAVDYDPTLPQALKSALELPLHRFRLLLSLPGVGPVVAATLVVRMPELGSMRRGQAAALAGLAPFDRDSGQWKGQRFIQGGRDRPRRMLYLAALAARRCSPALKAFADQLIARGKPKKLVVVAVMRKLVEAANLVLSRGQPWVRA